MKEITFYKNVRSSICSLTLWWINLNSISFFQQNIEMHSNERVNLSCSFPGEVNGVIVWRKPVSINITLTLLLPYAVNSPLLKNIFMHNSFYASKCLKIYESKSFFHDPSTNMSKYLIVHFPLKKHKENSFKMTCTHLQMYLVSHWTRVHIIIKLLVAAMYAINSKYFWPSKRCKQSALKG